VPDGGARARRARRCATGARRAVSLPVTLADDLAVDHGVVATGDIHPDTGRPLAVEALP
jgi:hypothetical protein